MKLKTISISSLALLTAVLSWLPLAHADDTTLGNRTLYDALATSPVQWETAVGVKAEVENNTLVLQTGDVEFGYASPKFAALVQEGAQVSLDIVSATGGQLGVQVEWQRADGSFEYGTSDSLGFTHVVSSHVAETFKLFLED